MFGMNPNLAYCPDAAERLHRLRMLYANRDPNLILAVMEVPSKAIREFAARYAPGQCEAPALSERCRFWDAFLAERLAVADDAIPSAYLTEMDQGLYGGLVGGEGHFVADPATGWISSMLFPLLKSWEGFERLRMDFDGAWGRRYQEQLAAFVRAASGKFGISHFILIDSLNFVFELFGAGRTYEELLDNPDKVHRAIDYAYDLNVKVQDMFFERVPLLAGGTCSNAGQWIPGRIVSESVDPFHMTSADYFEAWGREPVERILRHYDGGLVHLHGNGRHLLKAVSTIEGLKGIYLGDDHGFPPAFELLKEFRAQAGIMPFMVNVPYPAFARALSARQLEGNVLYYVKGLPDSDEANRLMDQVRAYRR